MHWKVGGGGKYSKNTKIIKKMGMHYTIPPAPIVAPPLGRREGWKMGRTWR